MKKIFGILIIICSLCFFGTTSWAASPKIIAEINEMKITADEFNEIAQGRTDRENLLNQIIASLLLAQEAKKMGLEKDQDDGEMEVFTRWAEIKTRYEAG